VAIHGYPDDHRVWSAVSADLDDTFHVVTYDVRGAGESDRPSGRAAYRMDRLVDDLVTVVDAVSPDTPVHLVGHDWGSTQAWPGLTDPRLAGRVASFTSIAGPALDHVAAWLRRAVVRAPRTVLKQLAESYYLGLFQIPGLPELAIERGGLDRALAKYAEHQDGEQPEQSDEERARRRSAQVAGLQLYRSNLLSWRRKPARIEVPVQVLALQRDPFLTLELQTEAPQPYVADLHTQVIDAGHWIVRDEPQTVARYVTDFAEAAAA
jgi:pimeloyl-ACP methyl ester carboxylesterase